MTYENFKPLVEVTRGGLVESAHFGAAAVVDSTGRLWAACGDPRTNAFLRSSSKPFQAMPLIDMGGVEAYRMTGEEIAITCASHSGTDEHFRVLASLQGKIGVTETDLKCGVHPPMHDPTWQAMIQRGEAPTPNRHNCSGKHTGMLAQARLRSLDYQNYLDPEHPVQKTILDTFSEMCDLDSECVKLGVDGCSAPVFSIPLLNAALGYARLVDPKQLPPKRADTCRVITAAMTGFPLMVAGPGRFDTLAMEAGGGKILCKGGAEGYLAIGVIPGAVERLDHGLGIAIKISDGDPSGRAGSITGLEILRQLGVIDSAFLEKMKSFYTRPVLNWRKLEVGEIRPVVKLVHYG